MSDDEVREERVRLAEAARLLGIDRRTLRRWIGAGRLRATKPGRCVLVFLADVKAILEEGQVETSRPRVERRAGRQQRDAWLRRALKGL